MEDVPRRENLSCALCRKVFTDPVTLQCNHTFCKLCLLIFTKGEPAAVEARYFPCAVCKQRTEVTTSDTQVEEWLSQLSPSLYIQERMNEITPGSTFQMEDNRHCGNNCCALCTEVTTDPTTLLCNHSFCKTCLLKYTTTLPETVATRSIPCPKCEQMNNVTIDGRPMEECVRQRKPSLSTKELEGDCTSGSFGNIPDDEELPASVPPSESCDKSVGQNRSPISQDWGNMGSPVLTSDPVNSLKCRKHRNNKVKRYCKICNIALCDECCITEHDGCDVESLQNMIPLFEDKLSCVSQQILNKMKANQENIAMAKEHIRNITNNAEKVEGQIRRAMKFSVKRMVQDVHIFSQGQINDLNAYIRHEVMRLTQYHQQYQYIKNAVTAYSLVEIHAIYESLKAASEEDTESNVDIGGRPVPEKIIFTQRANESGDCAFELEVVHDVSDRKSSAVLHHMINCHAENDKYCPDLIDVTVVSSSDVPYKIVIAADFTNRSLKYLYTSKASLHKGCLMLSDRPWQITKVDRSLIAVSIPDSKEIVTVKLTPDPTMLSTIRTKREYFALASPAPSKLLAGTFRSSNSVDLLDMEGNVLTSINTGSIVSPDYIQITDQQNILLGQGDVKSFVSVTSDGNVLYCYSPIGDKTLSCPRGFTTTSTGDVLLVDRDHQKVIQLTNSGRFVRDVLTEGLEQPRGLCLDDDGLMYVTVGTCVNVYTFQDLSVESGQGERKHNVIYSQRSTEV